MRVNREKGAIICINVQQEIIREGEIHFQHTQGMLTQTRLEQQALQKTTFPLHLVASMVSSLAQFVIQELNPETRRYNVTEIAIPQSSSP
ncbi:MAG: hypothetical protein H7A36_02450 [Chlamydiales bacterium]|nr:hypothetical protein [Chlamydiales bacterium]